MRRGDCHAASSGYKQSAAAVITYSDLECTPIRRCHPGGLTSELDSPETMGLVAESGVIVRG